jgi:glycosyltransferase involved in cell wall biosynthesis
MKIIAVLDCAIGAGGGFDQALNAINQIKRLSSDLYELEVFTTLEDNVPYLNQIGIKAVSIRYKKLDRLFLLFAQNKFMRRLFAKFKVISPFEKQLISRNCDLVYFLTPNFFAIALQKLNYITTLWDLCHRDSPEFPEVRLFGEFHIREENYLACLASALLILTDSNQLSQLASNRYGIDQDRFLTMPYAPSPLAIAKSEGIDLEILSSYGLVPGYFLYPAQFWSHKNHIRILQALIILKNKFNWVPKVVFLGKDKGNLPYLLSYIEKEGLAEQVKITGFVPSSHVAIFYINAHAVVMPTYFGPTNLPPLEAWAFGKPLIYSAHLSEQVGDAALLVDPDSEDELSDAMNQICAPDLQTKLIKAGRVRLQEIEDTRSQAELKFSLFLSRFKKRRECWE